MDALQYKILSPGDICWGLISSIESPYIYLPVKCQVFNVHQVNTLRFHYSVKILDFHDTLPTVIDCVIDKSFRQYNYDRDRLADRKIWFNTSLIESTEQFAQRLDELNSDEFFQVLAPLIFETLDDCISNLKKYEAKQIKQFIKTVKFYNKRYETW